MSNPLDNLPFDVNTLMPQTQFNWDCIDGIDCVHKDIVNNWTSVVKAAATPLAKVEATVQSIGQNIADHAAASIPIVEQTIDQQAVPIRNEMINSIAPLMTQYGSPGSTLQYYIVWREVSCDDWVPYVEQLAMPPSDRTNYGPYSDICALTYSLNQMGGMIMTTGQMPQHDENLASQIQLHYQQAIDQGFNNPKYCSATYAYPQLVQGTPIEQQCANAIPPPPIVTLPPSQTKWTSGTSLSCDEWCAIPWISFQPPVGELDPSTYEAADTPIWSDPTTHYFLTAAQYGDFLSRCDCGNTPPPLPPQPPPPINVPPIIQPGNCPAPVVNCPAPVVNITNTPTIIPPSGIDIGGISAECCNRLVVALESIAKKIGVPTSVPPPRTVQEPDCESMSDDAYDMSECLENDSNQFLKRLRLEYQPDADDLTITDLVKQQLEQMAATAVDENDLDYQEKQ